MKLLYENNADLDAQDSQGRTAVFVATCNKNFELVKYLVSNNADLFQEDRNGNLFF